MGEFLHKHHVGFVELSVKPGFGVLVSYKQLISGDAAGKCTSPIFSCSFHSTVEYLFINIYVLHICVEVFPQSPAMPKGRRALQRQPADFAPLAASIPVGSCGWNTFPKCAQSTSMCLQGQGLGCDCWRQEQKFPSTLSCVERLQTPLVGSAMARLCRCPGRGCGTSRTCVCAEPHPGLAVWGIQAGTWPWWDSLRLLTVPGWQPVCHSLGSARLGSAAVSAAGAGAALTARVLSPLFPNPRLSL